MSQNETYWNLSHRAIVIAWLKACVLYVANGCQWEKTIEDFVRWSLQYDLWCKMQFFGDDIEKATQEGMRGYCAQSTEHSFVKSDNLYKRR